MNVHKIRKNTIILLFILTFPGIFLFINTAKADETEVDGNKYPIVFIHGAGGFEQGELGDLVNYWGVLHDLLQVLRDHGYEVYELKVGPVSSIWDRSVEAFYDLKGGKIDYGAKHSDEFDHLQTTRTLQGKYPEWGEIAADGTRNKVHIIGHSMGGQTARGLVSLLGMVDSEQGESRLFNEDLSDWVASVTSISATHDGTTLVPIMKKLLNEVLKYVTEVDLPYDIFIQPLLAIVHTIIGENPIYDLMLDQFSLRPQVNESIWSYLGRTIKSPISWLNSEDFAIWDAQPQGAREVNEWAVADEEVFYFSYSTSATRKLPVPLVNTHIPKLSMLPLLYPVGAMLGFWGQDDGDVDINKDWYENDGVVNTISQNGPKLGSSDVIVEFNEEDLNPGIWNHMGKLDWDHGQVIGLNSDWNKVKEFYLNHAALLASLPGEEPDPTAVQSLVDDTLSEINELVNMTVENGDETANPYTDPATYEGGEVTPEDLDGDMDGMLTEWEEEYRLDDSDPFDTKADNDDDLLINKQEYFYGTSPISSDTDEDGIIDSDEIKNDLDPLVKDGDDDYDSDGLSNLKEINLNLDPWNDDTDHDRYTDREEILMGSDPLDKSSIPQYSYNLESRLDQTPVVPIIIMSAITLASVTMVVFLFHQSDSFDLLKMKLRPVSRKITSAKYKISSRMSNWISSRRQRKEDINKIFKELHDKDLNE